MSLVIPALYDVSVSPHQLQKQKQQTNKKAQSISLVGDLENGEQGAFGTACPL
jgi:hypothetical protein